MRLECSYYFLFFFTLRTILILKKKYFAMGLLYNFIKGLFHVTGGFFYATIEVTGLENVPKDGEATILCFNHGNSLGDAVVMIRSTPRQVRFCAKDSLWKVPVMGQLVDWSGAVPVYRIRDHGNNARQKNESMYVAVHDTLAAGDMIGIAPEGTSRFLPFMAKVKTGPARIALGAVRRNVEKNPTFCVKICPCGLAYTHREKFRSDVAVTYGAPIVVDASWLEGNGRFDDYEESVRALATAIEKSLTDITINAPDWETTRAAMTAARIHRPLGTKISLTDYLKHLRGWVEVLKPPSSEDEAMDADVKYIRAKLLEYQKLLDTKQIKDSRVRVTEHHGAIPKHVLVMRMVQRFLLCIVLFAFAFPGLIMWTPVWFAIKRREKWLLAKGPRWNDSVAEMKMLYSFGGVIAIGLLVMAITKSVVVAFGALLCIAMTVRFYESGLASARSMYTLFKLFFLWKSTMQRFLKMRRECKGLVDKIANRLPPSALHAADDAKDDDSFKAIPWYSIRWFEWTYIQFAYKAIMRREKKDWNELLRFNDYNTMDYVE